MIRKATSFLLLILLGLYLPAAATSVCLCLGPQTQAPDACPCVASTSCCEETETGMSSCCSDPDCCVVIPAMPDGMEPQLTLAPLPVAAPAPVSLHAELPPVPSSELRSPVSHRAPPPLRSAPIRIAYGVWRL
ncbi:hypothetical protein [Haloferula sp.]|uniref:hypothetical protein n=1 Tax=Haloferula sp. TaxID=2497595 RepID=UPI003C78124D